MLKQLILSLCICALLFGCSSKNGHKHEPDTQSTEIKVSYTTEGVTFTEAKNGLGAVYGNNKNMEVAVLQNVTYAFEKEISENDRTNCIRSTKRIIEKISPDKSIRINIYTRSTYDHLFIDGCTVYTHVQDWQNIDYICAVLYGIFGEYCNYGLIYGYADYLCSAVYGTKPSIYSDEWGYKGDVDALDLSLLNFRPEFSDEDTLTAIRKIACTFVNDYIEKNGIAEFQRLLSDSGTLDNCKAFAEALTDFYSNNGLRHTVSKVLYRQGGCTYDYIVKCHGAVMYIEKDWSDENKDLCPYTYDGFLHKNYKDSKQFFEINIAQMEQYKNLFSLDSYNDSLRIFFTDYSGANYSYYNASIHSIALRNTGSLMHEYIHSITYGSTILQLWANEGLARYFQYKFDYYGNAMNNVDLNGLPDTPRYKYINEYKANVGRDIDISEDHVILQHLATWANGYADPNDGGGYASGASFIGYLISRFGENEIIELICKTHDFGEHSYEELVLQWQTYIEENYSEYTKIK